MQEFPMLKSTKPLKSEFATFQEIAINSEDFTIGRGLNNMVVIPFLAISRNHCKLKKNEQNWILEDYSTFGINVNGVKVGKGNRKEIKHEDLIVLDTSEEFVYKFYNEDAELAPLSIKRIKLERDEKCDDFINDVKIKFEESQNHEKRHIEDKILNTKQIKTANMLLKEQLQLNMKRKIVKLENDFACQIENLKGEKNEVERRKALLLQERNAQSTALKHEMEGKIAELKEQIRKHNEIESELIVENNLLKEKLHKEREEFLSELNRENTLKQDMLDKLESKMKEQEEVRLKEKLEFKELLQKETEQLRLAKEKEFNELAEEKKQREFELLEELKNIKQNLTEQEKQKYEAQEQFNEQLEQMKKMKDDDKLRMEHLMQERLKEAQENAEKSIETLKTRVTEREVELAALASERIQKQAEQSSEVISSLQEQLEKVQNQLQNVENENKKLLENITEENSGGPSKSTLCEFGEIMESELQCSICAELFVSAITLNCSHTFCSYCITMWKKKKKDCPICRAPITSECKSLVLDSFIDKMVQNLTEEMKQKRRDMLKNREELETELIQQSAWTSRRSMSYEHDYAEDSEFLEEEEEEYEDFENSDGYEDHEDYDFGYEDYSDGIVESSFDESDSDSGPDNTGTPAAPTTSNVNILAGADERTSNYVGRRRRGAVPGRPGSYYGGYGRCFRCGARGHWAPGCPLGSTEQ